jgi:redox-sensitive bicupin YhaK (pirin superfamily)
MHRDSLGSEQVIRPGEVNWMTAGRGIVHSERTPPALRATARRSPASRPWVALPRAHEEPSRPSHTTRRRTCRRRSDGARVQCSSARSTGRRHPYARCPRCSMRTHRSGRGARHASGRARGACDPRRGRSRTRGGESFSSGQLLAFRPGDEIVVTAEGSARVLLLGGAPLDGPRHVWWNFVSSSQERIEQAKADWKGGGSRSSRTRPNSFPCPTGSRPRTVRSARPATAPCRVRGPRRRAAA